MAALEAAGLADSVEAIAVPCTAFRFENARGRVLGHIDRSGDRAAFGHPLSMVRRADLHAALARGAAEAGARLRLGTRVAGLLPDGRGVVLESGETVEADVVVGCDGLRSVIRQRWFPDAPAPVDSGLVDIAGFGPPVDGVEPGVNRMVFGRRGFFGLFVTPSGESWWFHNGRPGVGTAREVALAAHADDSPWIAELVRATPTVLGPWPLREVTRVPTWHRGPVALLGDAAHAMSPSAGQGASMAIEDAVVLATALLEESEVAAAFARYEAVRRGRVETIQKEARRNSNGKAVPNRVAEWFRDLALSVFLPLGGKAQSRHYGYRVPGAEAR